MKVFLAGKARELEEEVLRAGFEVTDKVFLAQAFVSDVSSWRGLPEGVPLLVLRKGGVADIAVLRQRPDAVLVEPGEVASKLREVLPRAGLEGLPFLVLSYANKGGAGKTTAAASAGVLLAEMGVKTLLWDLDFGGPDLAAFFGLKPGRGIEALSAGARPRDLVVKARENLFLLPGPLPGSAPRLSGEELLGVLAELAPEFPLVVGDTPPAPWQEEHLHPLFEKAGLVLAVVNQSLFSLEEVAEYAPTLVAMGVSPSRVRVVVTRFHPKLAPLKEVERAFCRGFKKGVRELPRVVAAVPDAWEEHARAEFKGKVLFREEWEKVAREVLAAAGGFAPPGKEKRGFFTWRR